MTHGVPYGYFGKLYDYRTGWAGSSTIIKWITFAVADRETKNTYSALFKNLLVSPIDRNEKAKCTLKA